MNSLFELTWGVDVAVKKLRPNAQFQLEGTKFTIWNDLSGNLAPSWDEIMQQMDLDKEAFESVYPPEAAEDIPMYLKNDPDLEEPVNKQRLSICNECDKFLKHIKVCSECYCVMPLKVKLAGAVCPIGKW
jgi:hypothetical protein